MRLERHILHDTQTHGQANTDQITAQKFKRSRPSAKLNNDLKLAYG